MIGNRIRTGIIVGLFIAVLHSGCGREDDPKRIIERGTVTDFDGNVYATVKIGDQWWMAENLRTRHFRTGESISFIDALAPDEQWAELDEAGMTYALDSSKGFLYNYYCISDARNIAPEGWRIPTDDDWKELETYIGMALPEVSRTSWRGDNEAQLLASLHSVGWGSGVLFGSDEYGFNAMPAGVRIHDGRRNIEGKSGFWWTSSPEGNTAWYRYMDAGQHRIFRHHTYLEYGMCIRCIKE